jgi:hypothetical protein
LFINALLLEIQLPRSRGWDPINQITLPGLGFPTSYVVVFFLFSEWNRDAIVRSHLKKFYTVKVNNSTNINKTNNNLSPNESFNSDGQQFHQYRERLLFVLLIMEELLTFTVWTFFRWEIIVCFVDIGGIVDLHCWNLL